MLRNLLDQRGLLRNLLDQRGLVRNLLDQRGLVRNLLDQRGVLMGVILLVRHGQASFGADDYDVLSETGWAQGRLLGAWLAGQGIVPTVVVRGDMRRHRETVEAIQEGVVSTVATRPLDQPGRVATRPLDQPGGVATRPLDQPGGVATRPLDQLGATDRRWDEFDHLAIVAAHPDLPADLTDRRAFQQVFEQATARWTAGEGTYEETFVAFESRVAAALADAAALAGPGQTVLVVSSGGPIGTVAASLTGGDWLRFNPVLVNTSITRVVVGTTGARLLTFNEHTHLGSGTLTYR